MGKIIVSILSLGIIIYGMSRLAGYFSSRYFTEDGKVYYAKFNNLTWKNDRTEVKEADPASFRKISGSGGRYGKDDDRVFYEANSLSLADPETFEVVDWREEISRDIKAVYWKYKQLSADPDGFEILGGGYYKDSKQVYFAGNPIEGVDPKNFEVRSIKTGGAEDSNAIYNLGRRSPE